MLPGCFNNFFQRNSDAHSRRTRQSNNLHAVAYAGGSGGAPMRASPSGLLRYMLKACVAQILLGKSYLNVEKFLRAIGARRGGHGVMPPHLAL